MSGDLADIYRDYIACLNKQDWPNLGRFVDDDARHNDRRIGLSGYRKMLEKDFLEIPDLHFNIQRLVADCRKPAPFRLYAQGKVSRPRRERKESLVHRKCLLSI